MKPIQWRDVARHDVAQAAAWYAEPGGLSLELRFIAAMEEAIALISRHPGAGSTRHGGVLTDLAEELRFLPVKRFDRYLIYYIDLPAHVDIVRVWDARRGLNALVDDAR